MIFDHRTYVCRPFTLAKQMALYEAEGFAVQSKHLGRPLLYAAGETGDPNAYVHVWVFRSADDRAQKRAAMMADPAWQAYIAKSEAAGFLISQNSVLLKPAPFFDQSGLAAHLS
ncbi:MAG: NIPSNAP family protein [Pseudomonadota bacterium]